ncbi:hypothetical protein [Streptomyces sp. NBC_01477]|uniref:hypothetical protein n=1 Tax=Streptomyces sp. NBC_01477 TaxID=2976015 RepID=UPI002E37A866|nr:hypothetical protein [Streptomyces sp. NBC_01477]
MTTPRISDALCLTEDETTALYLFKGTWAARYTLKDGTWQITAPFSTARHLSAWWPGLAATAGRKAYDAVWTAGDRIWLTAKDRVIRYDLSTGKLVEAEGALSGIIADLPTGFDQGVGAAMNVPGRVYLFRGGDYCSYATEDEQVTGGVKRLTGLTAVDGACYLSGTPYFFSGEHYYTGSVNDTDNTLSVDTGSKKKITDSWSGAPVGTPYLDIYCNPEGKLTRVRTDIDLTSGATTLPSSPAADRTTLNFSWTKNHFPPPFFYVTPDNRRAYVPDRDGEKVVAVDLTRKPEEEPTIWTAKLNSSVYISAMAPHWQSLWLRTGLSPKAMLTELKLDGGTTEPSPKYTSFPNMYGSIAVSPDNRTVYVGFYQGVEEVGYEFAVVDAATHKYSTTVRLGELKPDYLAACPDGKKVYVGTADKAEVTKVVLDKPKVLKSFAAGGRVVGLATTLDGTRCVAAVNKVRDFQKLLIIRTVEDTQVSVLLKDAKSVSSVAVDPHSRYAYVSDVDASTIWVVDLDRSEVAGSIPLTGITDLYQLELAPNWD